MLTQVMPDTPAELAGVAFPYENFEIASYRILRKVAESAEDEETLSMCHRLTPVEQQAAELIANNLDLAVQRSLESTVKVAGPAAGRDPGPHA